MINIARDNLLHLSEVASRFKVQVQTVRNWIKSGKLGAVKVGGRIYTNEECLNAMAEDPNPGVQSASKTPAVMTTMSSVDSESYQNILALLGQTTNS